MKDSTNKQFHIINILQVFQILFIIFNIIFAGCKNDPSADKIIEIDSLLDVTLNLQKMISSPEMQRLNDFSIEIVNDLSIFTDSVLQGFPPNVMTQELEKYISLQAEIENCLSACKNYNEEVFLIENNLTDLRKKLVVDPTNPEEIVESINTEKELLNDLFIRIQSNIGNIEKHIEEFYYLKPKIDELKKTRTVN